MFQNGICCFKMKLGFHMIAGSQTIASDRRQSQTIAEDRTWFYLLRSSAIMIADDRRSVFPYDHRRSQNFLRFAICDPRSSAIMWKPAFSQRITMQVETIYTFKNYLSLVKCGFLSQNKVEKICLISWGRFL